MPGGGVIDYPRAKLLVNRVVNFGIRVLFQHGYNDTTNAFKAYRREVIHTVTTNAFKADRREVIETRQPLLSKHFNLTVELPLKAVIRGHTFAVVPTT